MKNFKKSPFFVCSIIAFILLLFSCGPDDGEIIELNCSTASTSGTIIQGSPATNVFVNVSYTSDGEGSYESQTIQSTGVLGLTATIPAGNFSDGSGTISYTISGTPQSSGVASFAISVGGQSCTLTLNVNGGGQTGITAHSCGAPNVHNPAKTYGSMTDQQGNVYKTIVIGEQEWMAENLKTSIYRNGEPIPNVIDSVQWAGLTTGAWSYINNESQYYCPYGKFYNWYAVSDPRNICPTGWHIPTDAEWSVLINYLDPNADGGNNSPNVAGGKLKNIGSLYWLSPNTDATNESGFSGIPAGYRYIDGTFFTIGYGGIWWSSTEADSSIAWYRYLTYGDGSVVRFPDTKRGGLSVRCLRD